MQSNTKNICTFYCHWQEGKFLKREWLEMTENVKIQKQKEYAFVLDLKYNRLAPTNENKAWILIRKEKAILISKYPMVIQLKREVKTEEQDKIEFVCGIDDGSKHVGIAIASKCKNHNKVIFKGTIEQR